MSNRLSNTNCWGPKVRLDGLTVELKAASRFKCNSGLDRAIVEDIRATLYPADTELQRQEMDIPEILEGLSKEFDQFL
ncbi:hypothetical protein ACFL21_01770 [Patescibacteria group bacterium]